jgi:hypothetical protein
MVFIQTIHTFCLVTVSLLTVLAGFNHISVTHPRRCLLFHPGALRLLPEMDRYLDRTGVYAPSSWGSTGLAFVPPVLGAFPPLALGAFVPPGFCIFRVCFVFK